MHGVTPARCCGSRSGASPQQRAMAAARAEAAAAALAAGLAAQHGGGAAAEAGRVQGAGVCVTTAAEAETLGVHLLDKANGTEGNPGSPGATPGWQFLRGLGAAGLDATARKEIGLPARRGSGWAAPFVEGRGSDRPEVSDAAPACEPRVVFLLLLTRSRTHAFSLLPPPSPTFRSGLLASTACSKVVTTPRLPWHPARCRRAGTRRAPRCAAASWARRVALSRCVLALVTPVHRGVARTVSHCSALCPRPPLIPSARPLRWTLFLFLRSFAHRAGGPARSRTRSAACAPGAAAAQWAAGGGSPGGPGTCGGDIRQPAQGGGDARCWAGCWTVR